MTRDKMITVPPCEEEKMKFYRVHFTTIADSSHGYNWFSSQTAAEKARNQFHADHKEDGSADTTIDIVEIETTRKGILSALNLYASHPDNG